MIDATASGRLNLAASPVFAAMALAGLLVESDPAAVLCGGRAGSAFASMTTMYLLMSAFHAGPWLRLLRRV